MARAIGSTLLVLGLLAGNAAAQRPSLGVVTSKDASPPVATIGQPMAVMPPEIMPATETSNMQPETPPADSPQPATLPANLNMPPDSTFTGNYTTLPRPASQPLSVQQPGQPLLPPSAEVQDIPRHAHPYFDNLSLFFGFNGFQEPADLGINPNFGYRLAVNWGLPIFEQQGIGLQVGTAMNYSLDAGSILKYIDGTHDHWENFTTVGVFQRDGGSNWGAVYDFRFDNYYSRTYTGQWRFQYGFDLTPDNEIGFWATVRDHGANVNIGPFDFAVQPISQWNVFWRHVWNNESVTRVWIGLASEHSTFSAFLPPGPQINHPLTFGADFYVPLSDHFALFGEAHFITPNDTGVIAASVGFVWYPGSARGTARSRFAPLLPVANNTTFALDMR